MEAIINCMYERNEVRIYVRDGLTFFGYDGSKIIKYEQSPTEATSEDMKPLLILPLYFADPILKAIANAVKEKGIAVEDENYLKGKMEAIEFHLSDMREFAKILLGKVVQED